jgi:MFS family permease
VSNLGDGITFAALPLLVASLTRDPAAVAGVTLAARLPWLLFALPVGAFTDRVDRRRAMIAANVVRGSVALGLAAAVAAGTAEVWMLYLSGFVIGIAEVVYDNSAQTFLPSIVATPQLSTANGRMLTAELVANAFAGPPLGALLFSVAVSLPIFLDAGSFLLTIPLLAAIGGTYRAAGPVGGATSAGDGSPSRSRSRPRLHREIAEGLRWLWGNRLLRLLAVMLAVANLCGTMGQAIFVLFAQEELGIGDRAFGLLLTTFAVGGVMGGMVAGRVHRRAGTGHTLVGSYLTFTLADGLTGAAGDPWTVGLLSVAIGLGGAVWNVVTVSLRQTVIPDHLLGRVNSVYRFLGWGSIPLGALAGGLVADRFGVRAPFLVGGVVQLSVWAVAAPALVRLARAAEATEAAGGTDAGDDGDDHDAPRRSAGSVTDVPSG